MTDPHPRSNPLGLRTELSKHVRGEARFDSYSRHLFARDASMYSILPLGVIFPRDHDDVAAAVTIAGRHGVSVVARGAGTSLAGQTVGEGLVLDLSRHMNHVEYIDPVRRVARVQAGVVQDQLNDMAAQHGLMFGPDTSTSNRATIGGMIGNNSAGSGSVQYGMTIDHVRSLRVVLADGSTAVLGPQPRISSDASHPATLEATINRELRALVERNRSVIEEGFPKFWRRACGYRLDRLLDGPFDLAKFVVGSEGTLVIATSAEVDLVPKPLRTVYAIGHFVDTPSAIAATADALSCSPSQVELIDKVILDLSRERIEYSELGSILKGDPGALLFVSFSGDNEKELTARLQEVSDLWSLHSHGYHTLLAVTAAQQRALLKVRKSSLGLLMAASDGSRRPLAFVEDTAVDPVHLEEYIARFTEILDRHQLKAGYYGHCSVGCLHIRPFVDVSRPDEIAVMRAVATEVRDLVAEYGGVNSSEHGDGLARSEFNRQIFGDALYAAMVDVKRLFDPAGVLNPGKIVEAPSMTDNLRDAHLRPAAPVETRITFRGSGGMRDTADRCMNIGLCRKTTSGVMCPSYIATLDEEHSTRGRANALVMALSDPDPHAALADDRLHEILDLCLMCKACKSECPLGVDVATMKSEALAHRHDRHGVPLRSRVFGHVRLLNRIGSATSPISNGASRSRLLRRWLRRWLGITAMRPLPLFHRQNLIRWFDRRDVSTIGGGESPVVMLADSFTSYNEPGPGMAAVELLEWAGHRVHLAGNACCGRASFSKGLLDRAREQASAFGRLLAAVAPTGSLIVGVEPSCLFTLVDEHRALWPDDPVVQDVASRVREVEDLVATAIGDGRIELQATSWLSGRRIVYHGHCHQKAEVGTAATLRLLRLIPGAEIIELDAGCCGMAGSFGFEDEHYEVSMTVGDDRLFPAIRAELDSTIIAATGVSCRQQIAHGTSRPAIHPIELVRSVATPAAAWEQPTITR